MQCLKILLKKIPAFKSASTVRIFFEGGGEIASASLSTAGMMNYDLMKIP